MGRRVSGNEGAERMLGMEAVGGGGTLMVAVWSHIYYITVVDKHFIICTLLQ